MSSAIPEIDPELLPVNEVRPKTMGPLSVDNIIEARQLSDQARATLPDPAPNIVSVKHVVEDKDGRRNVYVYQPEGPTRSYALLWFHGGGYVMGSGDDWLGKQLAADIACTVVSVDYRLAPEHPHPAGLEDGIAALRWLRKNAISLGVGKNRIAIGGASAGGGLAAGVTMLNRDCFEPMPVFQFLMYPMLDNLHDTESGHIDEYPVWSRATSLNAWEMYLGGRPGVHASPYASPSRADNLSGLPPTYLCVGDVDLFRDENIAFMQRLTADGSPGEFEVYPGVYHGAEFQYPDAAISRRMYSEMTQKLRQGLGIG